MAMYRTDSFHTDRNWHFVVAVDGSDISRGAFETASAFAKRGDKVTVVHVYDPRKEGLPYELTAPVIEEYYKNRCIARFPTGAWDVQVKAKPVDSTTKQALMSFVNSKEVAADMLLVGFVGRKGPKEDPTVLGTSADFSVRASSASAAIVKSKVYPAKATIVVAVDGSDRSHFGVMTALHMAREEDPIIIVHVAEGAGGTDTPKQYDSAVIRERYQAFCSTHPRCRFVELPRDTGVSTSICKFANENDADVLLVGVDGMSARATSSTVLGSNSDAIVRKAPCTVICVRETIGYYTDADSSRR